MKPACIIFFFFATSIIFESCCKLGCIRQSLWLEFPGYAFRELDSTLIKKYEPESNFSVLIDSIYKNSAVTADDGAITLTESPEKIDLGKDYQIIIKSTGQVYTITNITTTKFKCPCESGTGRRVTSARVNNQLQEGEILYLKRE